MSLYKQFCFTIVRDFARKRKLNGASVGGCLDPTAVFRYNGGGLVVRMFGVVVIFEDRDDGAIARVEMDRFDTHRRGVDHLLGFAVAPLADGSSTVGTSH